MNAIFTVMGEPVGKARPRVTKFGHAYTPEKTVLYENLVKLEYERQCGAEKIQKPNMVALNVTAYFGIPSSASKKKRKEMLCGYTRPTKKPDCDNIFKTVADALNGLAYDDDSQVVSASIEKYYSDSPRIEVTVGSIE